MQIADDQAISWKMQIADDRLIVFAYAKITFFYFPVERYYGN